jgi:hypothetical protein
VRIVHSGPIAHALLGVVAGVFDLDWAEAERRFSLAMSRHPVPSSVRCLYGFFYLLPSGCPHAVEELAAAVHEDPMNAVYRISMAWALGVTGRTEEQAAEAAAILDVSGPAWHAELMMAASFARRGMLAAGLAAAERARQAAPWTALSAAMLAALLRRTGNQSRAEAILHEITGRTGDSGAPRALAWFHLLNNEIGEAVAWTKQALRERDPLILGTVAGAFRQGPHWPEIAKLAGLPE